MCKCSGKCGCNITQITKGEKGEKGDTGGVAPSYSVYTVLISQSATDAPVATILENTLGSVPVWSRVGVGQYRLTLSGKFLSNKIYINGFIVYPGTGVLPPVNYSYITIAGGSYMYTIYRIDDDTIGLDLVDNTLAFISDISDILPADAKIALPEIRIYP